MVHGNPTWSFYYRQLGEALSPATPLLVPDHIGCGQRATSPLRTPTMAIAGGAR